MPLLSVRVANGDLEAIDEHARARGLRRSSAVRALIGVGLQAEGAGSTPWPAGRGPRARGRAGATAQAARARLGQLRHTNRAQQRRAGRWTLMTTRMPGRYDTFGEPVLLNHLPAPAALRDAGAKKAAKRSRTRSACASVLARHGPR
jgi:hypothetical protein